MRAGKGWAAVLAASVLAVASAQEDRPLVDVELDDVSAPLAFATIGSKSGKTVLVAPGLRLERVTIRLKQVPWREAVEVIARMSHAEVVTLTGGTLLVSGQRTSVALDHAAVRDAVARVASGSFANVVVANDVQGTVTIDFKDVAPVAALRSIAHACEAEAWDLGGAVVVTKRRPEGVAPVSTGARLSQLAKVDRFTPVSIDVDGEDLREYCERGHPFGRGAPPVLVDPSVDEKLSVRLHDVPWCDALAYVALLTRCQIEDRGKVLVLTQPPPVTIRTRGATVASLLKLLSGYAGKNLAIGSGSEIPAAPMNLESLPWMTSIRVAALTNGFKVFEDSEDAISVTAWSTPAKLPSDETPAPAIEPPAEPRAALERAEAIILRGEGAFADATTLLERASRSSDAASKARARFLSEWSPRIADVVERGKLVIEAVVTDARPESKDRCLVGGRALEIGDEVLDGKGVAIPAVRVVKILKDGVRFRLEDVEFERRIR